MKFRLLKPLTIFSTLLIILLCFTASASAFFVSSEKTHVGKIFFSDAFFTRNFSPLTADNTPDKNYDDKKNASDSLLVPKSGADFFKNTKYTDKVIEQMSKGDFHSFPEMIKNYAKDGVVTKIKGKDGIVRDMLEIPGSYGGKDGVFQFIKEADGSINHRLFKPYKK